MTDELLEKVDTAIAGELWKRAEANAGLRDEGPTVTDISRVVLIALKDDIALRTELEDVSRIALKAMREELEDVLDEMELHDDTGDPFDEGYMKAVREMRAALQAAE